MIRPRVLQVIGVRFFRNIPTWLLTAVLTLSTVSASEESRNLPIFVELQNTGIDFVHINGEADHKDYIPEAKGGGIGLLDYDGDGWIDLYVVQGSTIEGLKSGRNPHGALFRNQRDGTFKNVTLEAGLTHTGWGMGVGAADYDNDGDVDLYLTYWGPNVLYENNGDGTFTDATAKTGLGDPRWSTSAAFGDYDRDGDLDLYVSNYLTIDLERLPPRNCSHRGNIVLCGPSGLVGAADALYRNNGDGTFSDVTLESGAVDVDKQYGLGCLWADFDNDHDLDILVANDATPNLLFVNRGDGTFEELGFLSGLAVNADGMEQAGMGVDAADYNNDGLLDVFMTHFALEYSTLYLNKGDLLFEDVTAQARIVEHEWLLVSWGTRFVDFNHDGWKDIIHSNGHVYPYLLTTEMNETYAQPKSFYLNKKNGAFEDVSREVGPDPQNPKVGRAVAFGDLDNDGDIDFAVSNMNGIPSIYRCDSAGGNHWIMFQLRGRESNRDGIGARITIETGLGKQIWEIKRTLGIYAVSDPRAHFGTGTDATVRKVTVWWPSGTVQTFEDVAADRHYLVDEKEGLLVLSYRD